MREAVITNLEPVAVSLSRTLLQSAHSRRLNLPVNEGAQSVSLHLGIPALIVVAA
jgi:hypothetical protein